MIDRCRYALQGILLFCSAATDDLFGLQPCRHHVAELFDLAWVPWWLRLQSLSHLQLGLLQTVADESSEP